MNVKIGAKIKELRNRDGVTQERLAEALGVTSQAVSKWESESGYPDIEYITPIANFFNVTTDYLFNHDMAEKLKKIDEYCKQTQRKLPQERIEIMRQALAEFPAEEKLLFILAEALFDKWKTSPRLMKMVEDCAVYDPEKSSDGWKEPTVIFEKFLSESVDDSVRGRCLWYLAMIYGKLGEKEKLAEIAEKCAPVSRCRQVLLAHATLESKEREKYQKEAVRDLLWDIDTIISDFHTRRMWDGYIFDLDENVRFEADDAMLEIYIKMNKVLFRDGNSQGMDKTIINKYFSYASNLAMEEKIDEAYEKLEDAYKHAKNFDYYLNKKNERRITPDPNDLEHRLLPYLLKELKIETRSVLFPGNPRYTELINKIEADIAGT